ERLAAEDPPRVGQTDGGPRARRRGDGLGAPAVRPPPHLYARRRGRQQEGRALARRALEHDVARMDARRARGLVGGLVLVEQDERARRRHWRKQRRARAGREPRRAVGQLPPRLGTNLLVHAGVEPDDLIDLREPLRPARRRVHVGRDHERAALGSLDALEHALLPTRTDQQRGASLRRVPRGAGGWLHASGVARAPSRRALGRRTDARPERRRRRPRSSHFVRRRSYSRLASFRSSQAMRRYSGPGLRSRNAGWNVGISTAEPYGWTLPRSLPIA